MLMLMVSSPFTRPSPLQLGQWEVISVPSPLQVGQVVLVCICASMLFVRLLTEPAPLQVRQVLNEDLSFAPEPSQFLHTLFLLTLIFFSTPFAISSRVSLTLIRRLVPRATRRPAPECPALKKDRKSVV